MNRKRYDMPVILHLETSTTVCSVCLSENGKVLYEQIDTRGQNHSELLGLFVQSTLKEASLQQKTIDAVAVSSGPGSYTGLRIGVSMAKGLCYGFSIPLIGINSLQLIAQELLLKHTIPDNAILCPMIDARRMEVYTALYSASLETIKPTWAEIIEENSFAETHHVPLYIFGNGAAKCLDIVQHPAIIYVPDIYPKASTMIALAEKGFENKQFEDSAYFEPFYLKEFMISTPKNKFA